MKNTFGDLLKEMREQRGLSQRQLAMKFGRLQGKEDGATTSLVSGWELGLRNPSRESIELLAQALNATETERKDMYVAAGLFPNGVEVLSREPYILWARAEGDMGDQAREEVMEFIAEMQEKYRLKKDETP